MSEYTWGGGHMNEHEHEVSWDYDECDREGCGEFATHRMYVGDEVVAHYCDEHASAKQSELHETAREVENAIAAASILMAFPPAASEVDEAID
jgi:hypothetical protein